MTLSDLHAKHQDERRALIAAALQATNGNRSAAARALGTQRTYLHRLIRELGVSGPPPRSRRPSSL